MNIEMSLNFPASRREQVANVIRDAIITGQLNPGDRIREKEISEKLGISRGPIREALRQLEEEGLIKYHTLTRKLSLPSYLTLRFQVS